VPKIRQIIKIVWLTKSKEKYKKERVSERSGRKGKKKEK